MELKYRILIWLSMFFWGALLFWYFGSLYFFLLPFIGIIYIVWGGKIDA